MPHLSDRTHFHGRHHLMIVLVIVTLCTIVLSRIGAGSRIAGETQPVAAIPLQLDPNTASVQELAAIPGVGPGLAERIVLYRNRRMAAGHSPAFAEPGDLDHVDGIGKGTLEAISPYLRLAGGQR